MPQGIEKFGESYVCTHAQSLQQCLTLCDPVDYSLPGSSVHGILQARILEWVALPSSRGSFWPRDRTHDSWIEGKFFTTETPGKPRKSYPLGQQRNWWAEDMEGFSSWLVCYGCSNRLLQTWWLKTNLFSYNSEGQKLRISFSKAKMSGDLVPSTGSRGESIS